MRDIRLSLASIIFLLICIGIVMIYSSSGVYALQELGNSLYFLSRHLLYLLIGFMVMLAAMTIDYRELRNYAKPLLVGGVILLIFVLIPGIGKESFGARRWFRFAGISFQPSEFVKLAMLIYVSDFLARKHDVIRDLKQGFLPVIFVLGTVCCLTVLQPDFGTTVFIGIIVLVLMFMAGAKIEHISMLGAMALPVVYLLVVKAPYRMVRIMTFLDPFKDPQGAGFQLTQSQIALGSGKIFGVGLGKSVQKLFYLPAAHTDFILSIIGEELGLIGAFSVILLFAMFIWQGARVVKRTSNTFGYFLAAGIVLMIGLQAVINIGVSIGALPTKGLPLPFISYGGSALVFNMISVGLLLNISRTEDL